MLVTFTSSTSGEILMFSQMARRLFEIIGKTGSARGVFTKEQLPDAIEKLRQAIAAKKANPDTSEVEEIEDEDDPQTSDIDLAQRAHPFIELLESTRKEDGYVMWHAANDF